MNNCQFLRRLSWFTILVHEDMRLIYVIIKSKVNAKFDVAQEKFQYENRIFDLLRPLLRAKQHR